MAIVGMSAQQVCRQGFGWTHHTKGITTCNTLDYYHSIFLITAIEDMSKRVQSCIARV